LYILEGAYSVVTKYDKSHIDIKKLKKFIGK